MGKGGRVFLRHLNVSTVFEHVVEMCKEANYSLRPDVINAYQKALEIEESNSGKEILNELLENARIAREKEMPTCQDTGFAVFFVELGQDIHLVGGNLYEAINNGVRRGYTEGYLRKSVVNDPIQRINTKDNSPSIVHLEIVPGDDFKITFMPKGFGGESMSSVKMLFPKDGHQGIVSFVVNTVLDAGAYPCPPLFIGVGIGGTIEKVAYLAKKALLRPIDSSHPNFYYAEMEKEILSKVNNLGIGPQGLGGINTALAVHIETYPCHIASLATAVNINCHAHRLSERII